MRVRRAHEGGVSLARNADVIGVAARAGEQPQVLDAANRLADAELDHVRKLQREINLIGIETGFCKLGRSQVSRLSPRLDLRRNPEPDHQAVPAVYDRDAEAELDHLGFGEMPPRRVVNLIRNA